MKKGRTETPNGYLFVYICVQVLIFVDAGTGSALEFTKRSEGQTFRKIYSISVGDCLKECEQRPKCVSVNYHRRKLTCHLNEFDGANVHAVSEQQPGFVYARKDPVQATLECGAHTCTLNQKCDEETNSCVFKECTSIQTPPLGSIFGNILSVGSKLSFVCEEGFTIKSGNDYHVTLTSECLAGGRWRYEEFECVPKCTSIQTPPLGSIFGNILSVGSKLSFVCEEGFTIKSGNDYHVTLTSECLAGGRWRYEEFECVPTTCKVRKQMTSTLLSGEFEFTDTETKEKINIFCDFYDGYGHTFVSKQDFGKLSNLDVHYTRTDYVTLRSIRKNDVQGENRVAVLPAYSRQYNLTVLLNSSEDFSSPRQKDTNGPFILVGFVPNSYGPKNYTTHGYACNDEELSYNNCDNNNDNYFVVYSGSKNNSLRQHNSKQNIAFGWSIFNISITGKRYLPVYFFGLFEMGMGGCGAFISQDKGREHSTVTGVAVGMRFDL